MEVEDIDKDYMFDRRTAFLMRPPIKCQPASCMCGCEKPFEATNEILQCKSHSLHVNNA